MAPNIVQESAISKPSIKNNKIPEITNEKPAIR